MSRTLIVTLGIVGILAVAAGSSTFAVYVLHMGYAASLLTMPTGYLFGFAYGHWAVKHWPDRQRNEI